MQWLYLDESGDLGFDFVNKKPSKHFTVCVLAVNHRPSFVHIKKAVRKTLRKKLNKPKKPAKGRIHELKGTNTSLEVKQYFYKRVQNEEFEIYSVTLNKLRVYESLARDKDRVYNWIARMVLERIPLMDAGERVQLVIDKCKNKHAIAEFNGYIEQQLKSRLDPRVLLDISHLASHKDPVLQATDLFSWGIFRKYERRDRKWYDVFEGKVKYDDLYLK